MPVAVADCGPNDDGRAGLGHELRESILVRELAYRNLREFLAGTNLLEAMRALFLAKVAEAFTPR